MKQADGTKYNSEYQEQLFNELKGLGIKIQDSAAIIQNDLNRASISLRQITEWEQQSQKLLSDLAEARIETLAFLKQQPLK